MFWNDPIMYGYTPYRDVNLQNPYIGMQPPWQTQRFVPNFPPYAGYGMTPPVFNPMIEHLYKFDPLHQTQAFNPLPFNYNLPVYNWQRPFTF